MIVPYENQMESSKSDLLADIRSTFPPFEDLPSFEESTNNLLDHRNGHVSPYQDPPPFSSPYVASYFVDSEGSTISHDPHLNKDGEALYRFLQASKPPSYRLFIRGTHTERKERHRDRGDHKIETKTRNELVTDFDFAIDLNLNIVTLPPHAPIQWSVRDDEPAYRGKLCQQIETVSDLDGRVTKPKATKKRLKEYRASCRERDAAGLPPWAYIAPSPHNMSKHQSSSRTVRQWCDDYCSSNKHLKEFVYTKVVYGWDVKQLTAAIKTLIVDQIGYMGDLQIEFSIHPKASNLIIIRPSNRLSRALSHIWIKFLLIITLIYPFILLYKRFHHRGRGIWKVCGGAYPLKVTRIVQHKPEIVVDAGPSSAPRTNITYTEEHTGEREGVWFRRWQSTIRHYVVHKRRESVALIHPEDCPSSVNPNAMQLDGYEE